MVWRDYVLHSEVPRHLPLRGEAWHLVHPRGIMRPHLVVGLWLLLFLCLLASAALCLPPGEGALRSLLGPHLRADIRAGRPSRPPLLRAALIAAAQAPRARLVLVALHFSYATLSARLPDKNGLDLFFLYYTCLGLSIRRDALFGALPNLSHWRLRLGRSGLGLRNIGLWLRLGIRRVLKLLSAIWLLGLSLSRWRTA